MIHLLDSNVIIYAAKPQFASLRSFLARKKLGFSQISYIEVLGFHKISDDDKAEFEEFFSRSTLFPLTDQIAEKAVEIRQLKRTSLGDSIVAATAIVGKCTLVTRNVKDFDWISVLTVIDPFDVIS